MHRKITRFALAAKRGVTGAAGFVAAAASEQSPAIVDIPKPLADDASISRRESGNRIRHGPEFAVGSVNAHQRPLDMDLVADSPTSAYAVDGELANKILEQPAESFAGL